MEINELTKKAHDNAVAHGFHEDGVNIPEALALIHSEVSEALECYRDGDMHHSYTYTRVGEGSGDSQENALKPIGFPSELADVVIRTCSLAGVLGIDLGKAIAEKMAYNETRPYKHGKVC